jgi:hypothetical protein
VKIRTSNLLIRSQMLYPVELRAQNLIFLAPPQRDGAPYYIRFEPPSNVGKRIRAVHCSLRTGVIAAVKERATLTIESILKPKISF